MKTIKNFKPIVLLALIGFVVFSCSDDDDAPAPVVAEELITNVNVTFTNASDSNDVVTLTAVSADGIVDPTLSVDGTFTSGTTYNATVTITDEINNENILEEIVEEKDEHFFVYALNTVDFTMTRAENDEVRTDGERLGLNTTWTADAVGTGTITVQLIHEPTTIDASANDNLGSASGGEFDINNTWSIAIQ